MHKLKTIFSFVMLIYVTSFSQTEEPRVMNVVGNYSFKVDSIEIKGNNTTKDYIILRELTFGIGDTITPKIVQYNKERIFSLEIFTKVDLNPVIVDNKNILIISVEESWYIYPIPFVSLKDKDWKKISYGAYLVLKNFRGRNESLFGEAAFGYDPSFALTYHNPYLLFKQSISLSVFTRYGNIKNKSLNAELLYGSDFSNKSISGGFEIGKRFGLYNRFKTNISYNYIEAPTYLDGITASDSRIDRYPAIGFNYSYDTRDLIQFPKNGIFASADYTLKGLGINGISYQVTTLDFREYRPLIGDLISKWRFTCRLTSGKKIPYYDYSFLGYNERIRGHYFREMEGNNYYLASLQFNYPIIKDLHVKLDFIPIIPKELLSYRIAFYWELFGDTGATKNRGQSFSINDFKSGYGTGLALLVLPYSVLRVELAFDEYKNTQWIFDAGISF